MARAYSRIFRTLVMALGVATVMGGIMVRPARAHDDDWHHGHEGWREHNWREHEWRERGWRWHHPQAYSYPGYPGYAYGYAPPPVIYAPPPPVYYAPAPPPIYYQPQSSVGVLFHFH
jgi:hypothetical protein